MRSCLLTIASSIYWNSLYASRHGGVRLSVDVRIRQLGFQFDEATGAAGQFSWGWQARGKMIEGAIAKAAKPGCRALISKAADECRIREGAAVQRIESSIAASRLKPPQRVISRRRSERPSH